MTRYFYDSETSRMLAYEEGAERVRVLSEVIITTSAEPKIEVPKPVERPERPAPTPAQRSWAGQAPRKAPGCAECGSKGRRHKKDCPLSGASKGAHTEITAPNEGNQAYASLSDKRPGLTRMQYGRVKISQEHNIEPEVIARNFDVDVSEVEKAFDAENYAAYLGGS
jgi:hypothetical protein